MKVAKQSKHFTEVERAVQMVTEGGERAKEK